MDREVPSQNIEDQVVIRLKGVFKKYRLYNYKIDRMKEALHPLRKRYHKDFYALKDIDLEVNRGEILGIIGKNGSGKSTLLKVISGVVTPTAGKVMAKGNIVPLLQLGTGFNPEYTGLENIFFYSSVLGYSKAKIREKVDAIIDFADIGDYLYQPLRTYSTGMRARLAFAVSVNIEPDILILDEILSVGDELFRRKCYARMQEIFQSGKTILFVSHSVNSINELCQRAVFLDRGEKILEGDARFVTMMYQKYLFTIHENPEEMREEIRTMTQKQERLAVHISHEADEVTEAGKISNVIDEESIGLTTFKQEPFLIPGFLPKSTTVTKNAAIEITDIHLETLDGKKVNALLSNEEYRLCYRVTFQEAIHKVRYAMAIFSVKGALVSSVIMPSEDEPVEAISAGDRFIVGWRFTCSLLRGNYFVEIGVKSVEDKEPAYFVRIMDALVFKVMDSSRDRFHGLVRLNQQLSIEKEQVDDESSGT